ncbi:hypothetical protein GCM10029964_104570 [Kibdelosporangium lantanae]
MATDPPAHTRLRRLVAKAFTARRVERMRDLVRGVVNDLIDAQPTDLVTGFAWPLPMIVIAEVLGVPAADRPDFHDRTEETLALGVHVDRTRMENARSWLWTYLGGLAAQRRAQPADDLLSDMVAARDENDQLTDEELARLGVTLLIGGFETTANQIGNSLLTLLANNREGWLELVADPALVPSAVEELLRYLPWSPAPSSPGWPARTCLSARPSSARARLSSWRCTRPTGTPRSSPTPTPWTWPAPTTRT